MSQTQIAISTVRFKRARAWVDLECEVRLEAWCPGDIGGKSTVMSGQDGEVVRGERPGRPVASEWMTCCEWVSVRDESFYMWVRGWVVLA